MNSETFLQSAACCEELLKETKNSKESWIILKKSEET